MQAEIVSGDFRFYMDLKFLGESSQNNAGSGGVPIAVGTDIVSNSFDFLPAPEVEKKAEFLGVRNLFSRS